jgi:FKBP-type peptidyl-prolyl cis-trans isomerase
MRPLCLVIPLGLALGAGALPARGADPAPLASDKERQSYAIGVDIEQRFERLGAEVDVAALVRGIREAAAHQKLALDEEELKTAVAAFQADLELKRGEAQKRGAAASLKAGEVFRDNYANQSGVVKTASGLMYRMLQTGNGPTPKPDDVIECRYEGRLVDGRAFERSPGKDPVPIELKALIAGWRELLPLVPVGSKVEVVIPPALAYGERGNGREVGPNATLLYSIELTGIKPRPCAARRSPSAACAARSATAAARR